MSCGNVAVVDDEADADLVVVVVDDYLQTELRSINEQFHKARKRWMPLKLSGIEGMMGPLFNLSDDGFCPECLRTNLQNSRELRGFLGHNRAGAHVANEPNILINAQKKRKKHWRAIFTAYTLRIERLRIEWRIRGLIHTAFID